MSKGTARPPTSEKMATVKLEYRTARMMAATVMTAMKVHAAASETRGWRSGAQAAKAAPYMAVSPPPVVTRARTR